MGLWKHGVEQILEVAGMQNHETDKHLPGKYQLNWRHAHGLTCLPIVQANQKAPFRFLTPLHSPPP